jgi:hypothetical protein
MRMNAASAPELTVPVRVIVIVVSRVASCANMADRPSADAVISIHNRFIVIELAPFVLASLAGLYECTREST